MKSESTGFMTIGQLAKAADTHVETIRYYQRIGLMPVPAKPAGGIRRYSQVTVQRLYFIRRAKNLGFTLKDIHLLLQLDEQRCDEVRKIAGEKLSQIRSRIADLKSIAVTLKAMIRQCESSNQPACPIIDSLTQSRMLEGQY